ncbi:MAG: GNAT family N-acetyltransferase [Candidatus Limiplasma sp.]|nr:GNAT family N-acetyltransferase [Candidatus Limiplasma sp.]
MVQGKWFPTGCDLSQPLAVRQSVFGRGRDDLDDWAQQVAVYAGDDPVGAARLWWQDGAFWLGDVGVLPHNRGMGYGDLLVRLLLFKALSHGTCLIRLETPLQVAPFFARYGFREESSCDGQTVMVIAAGEVHLDHCGGKCAGCSLCPQGPDAGPER